METLNVRKHQAGELGRRVAWLAHGRWAGGESVRQEGAAGFRVGGPGGRYKKKHRRLIDGCFACVWVCECVVWERGRTDTQGSSQPEAYRQ